MRISTMQQYNINIERMQNSQTTIGELQRQISTGKKYHQPSDAPAVAATAIRLERDIAALDRYDGNIKIATNRLELEEVMLTDMNTQIDRLNEKVLSVDAGENDENLKVIAEEIRTIVDSLAGAMNKKDAQGEYIFSGSKGFTQPYVLNSSGRWEYQGDNGQRDIQIGATHYVASGDSGQYLFETVPGELEYAHSGADVVDLEDNITFKDQADQDRWEGYLEREVNGDLKFEVYPTETGTAGNYDVRLVDSSGKVHQEFLDQTLSATHDGVHDLTFEGAQFDLKAPVNGDFTFKDVSGTRDGVSNISIADNAVMDQYFEDYGDVQVELTAGTPATYQLHSSKLGGYISVGGENSWVVPASNELSVGGLELDLVTPIVNEQFQLQPPGPNSTVTSTSHISDIAMEDQTAYAAAVTTARGAGAVGFKVTIVNEAPLEADIIAVDEAGANVGALIGDDVALTDNGDGTYSLLDAAGGTVAGLQFNFESAPSLNETVTLNFDKLVGADRESLVVAESTNKVDYGKKNILNIGLEIAEQLEKGKSTPELQKELEELLAQTIDDIELAQDKLNTGLTGAGARLASLEETETANLDIKLFTQTTLSGIQDADLAAVASEFKLEQTLLEASQQTFATVSRISLFEYIR